MKITCSATITDKAEYASLEEWVRNNAESYGFFSNKIYASGIGDKTVMKKFIDRFEKHTEHSIQIQKEGG